LDFFRTTADCFLYNNHSAGLLENHSRHLAKFEKVLMIELDFPWGVFTTSFRGCDLDGQFPVRASFVVFSLIARECFEQDVEDCEFVWFGPSCLKIRFHASAAIAGDEWDCTCLGIAILFGPSNSVQATRFYGSSVKSVAGLADRSPLCSFMLKMKDNITGKRKKLGERRRVGLPISSFAVGDALYVTTGRYCGVGFGGYFAGIGPFIRALDELKGGKCLSLAPSDYSVVFAGIRPPDGSAANATGVALTVGCAFRDEKDDRLLLRGIWGGLLIRIIEASGRKILRDPRVGARFLSASDYDDLCEGDSGTVFQVLECVFDTIGHQDVRVIELASGPVVINNDMGGALRLSLV